MFFTGHQHKATCNNFFAENLFGTTKESYTCPDETVELICNMNCITSYWIIDGTYYYWQDLLPEGYIYRFPSTLILDAVNVDLNFTRYQCLACNIESSIITLVVLGEL